MKEIIQPGTPQRFRDTVVAAKFCCPNCGISASYDWALTLREALELAPAKDDGHGQ